MECRYKRRTARSTVCEIEVLIPSRAIGLGLGESWLVERLLLWPGRLGLGLVLFRRCNSGGVRGDSASAFWRAGDEDPLTLVAFTLAPTGDALAALGPFIGALQQDLLVSKKRKRMIHGKFPLSRKPRRKNQATYCDAATSTRLAALVLAGNANHVWSTQLLNNDSVTH